MSQRRVVQPLGALGCLSLLALAACGGAENHGDYELEKIALADAFVP